MGPYFHSCPRDQPKARVRAKGWFLVHDDLAEIPSPCSSSNCKHTPSVAFVPLTEGEPFSRALRQDILSQHTTRIRTRNRHGRPEYRLLANGTTSNFVNPPSVGNRQTITNIITLIIMIVVVLLRLYTRIFIVKSVGYDDCASISAEVSSDRH